jgi:hypothetical protein
VASGHLDLYARDIAHLTDRRSALVKGLQTPL